MTTEAALLAAIAAHPGEDTPRLALADYYDEFGEREKACDQRLAVALRAVKAEPDDDAPRLAYAAVCGEYGRTHRGEFIRVQCELARFPEREEEFARLGGADRKRYHHLLAAQQNLLTRAFPWRKGCKWGYYHCAESRIDLGDGEPPELSLWFARGFGHHVSGPADKWDKYGDELAAEQPLRTVKLTSTPRFDELKAGEFGGEPVAPDARVYALAGKKVLVRENGAAPDAVARCVLQARWPGIAFEVPRLLSTGWDGGTGSIVEHLRDLRDRIVRDSGGPTLPPAGFLAKPRVD